MKKIVITNVYGYMNIGDGSILDSTITLISKSLTKNIIHIHAASLFSVSKNNRKNVKVYLHPYGIATKTVKNPISDIKKISRFLTVISVSLYYSLLGKIFSKLLPEKGNYSYIRSLKEADCVFGIGGGYLRTKNKYKDFFGLLLTLLPIYIAHLYNKRVLYLPMSYGNFASSIHENVVFQLIKNDVIIFRDEISLQKFKIHAYRKADTYLIPDLALFDTYKNVLQRKKNYIVLTARLWMNASKQRKYEQDLALFIDYIWEKYKLKTIFIPMVWNEKEENDTKVGKRIQKYLLNKKIFTIISVKTSLEVKKILSSAKISICTRMHSAIFSTLVKTPFITIAYEHKTNGLLELLGLQTWNIDIQDFSFIKLKEKFDDLLNKRQIQFINQLSKSHMKILEQENQLSEIIRSFSQIVS